MWRKQFFYISGLNAEFKVTQAAAATEDSYLKMKGSPCCLLS